MDKNQEPDLAQAMQLANSPAGKELLKLLQQKAGNRLQNAMASANNGDYSQARDTISDFLSSPEAKALLEQLGGNK